MTEPGTVPFALFDDATWPDQPSMLLSGSQGEIEARTADDVPRALAEIEAGIERGLIAAGYCAYELGYVFENRLQALMPDTGRPLLRFHLFAERDVFDARRRGRWLMERCTGPVYSGNVQATLSAGQHAAKFAQVKRLIGDGDVYQVNLTLKLKLASGGDSFATYMTLCEKARAGASAFLRFGDEDILSFSPELFFRVQQGRILARPMKGTIARPPDIEGDELQRRVLSADEKQRAENLMIVDLLRNDLARVSKVGSVEVTDLFTLETFPRFHTLTSGIEAHLKPGAKLSTILPALFPCGSVTGAPKIRAMEIIREVEDSPRGVYCGAIGYAARNSMAFNVAIRTLTVRDGQAEMGVGGGIVWDSEAESEYDECLLKARFLTEPHEPFRLLETLRWSAECGFRLLERHLTRLERSSRYFGFRFNEVSVRRHLNVAVAGAEGMQRVRLTLGVRGDTQVETKAFALPQGDGTWRYRVCETPMQSADWWLHHKTTRREVYDQARTASGCDEVVFVNERGELTEGSRSTLFVERDGVWLTPPLSSGVLDGCLRREMIENDPRRVEVQVLRAADLTTGNVWFGNSLRGLVRGMPEHGWVL
ncbi:MAG: aminodeoxychorismate synthase component I [Alphaproteobacteria bacterium]|nr:aminodeoxychorismate synthase component I [Alphaproteobacteria bacterium]